MSTQNRNNQRNNYKRGNQYKRGNRYKRKYNNKQKFNKIPKVEKCPFVVGTNEYFTWKRERYPTRTLYGCNNKVIMVFKSKYNI